MTNRWMIIILVFSFHVFSSLFTDIESNFCLLSAHYIRQGGQGVDRIMD